MSARNKGVVDLLDDDALGRTLYATKQKCGPDRNGQTRIRTGGDDETRTRDLRRDRCLEKQGITIN